jgi:hypothetical protein
MIITTVKGKKKHVTSSYFKDMDLLRQSEVDTNFSKVRKEKTYSQDDIEKLRLAYAIQKIVLFKQGCGELSSYINSLADSQLENVVPDYRGTTYEEYTGPITNHVDTTIRPLYRTSGDVF